MSRNDLFPVSLSLGWLLAPPTRISMVISKQLWNTACSLTSLVAALFLTLLLDHLAVTISLKIDAVGSSDGSVNDDQARVLCQLMHRTGQYGTLLASAQDIENECQINAMTKILKQAAQDSISRRTLRCAKKCHHIPLAPLPLF